MPYLKVFAAGGEIRRQGIEGRGVLVVDREEIAERRQRHVTASTIASARPGANGGPHGISAS